MVFGWPNGWDISDEISVGISVIVGRAEHELLFWDATGINKHVSPEVGGVNNCSLDVDDVGEVGVSIGVAHFCLMFD